MTLELVQQNDEFYLFIFSFVNYILGMKKKTYIFVRKTIKYVRKLMCQHADCSSSSSDYVSVYHKRKEYVLIDNMDRV